MAATCIMALTAGAVTANAPDYRQPPQTTRISPPMTAPSPPTTLVRTHPDAPCGLWWAAATEAGWSDKQLPRLDTLLYAESRCDPTQHNDSDPNGGSYGLMQINGFWCQPSRYYPAGYLQTFGILKTCRDLYDPMVAFTAGLAIYSYSLQANGCGWQPWATMTCP